MYTVPLLCHSFISFSKHQAITCYQSRLMCTPVFLCMMKSHTIRLVSDTVKRGVEAKIYLGIHVWVPHSSCYSYILLLIVALINRLHNSRLVFILSTFTLMASLCHCIFNYLSHWQYHWLHCLLLHPPQAPLSNEFTRLDSS